MGLLQGGFRREENRGGGLRLRAARSTQQHLTPAHPSLKEQQKMG